MKEFIILILTIWMLSISQAQDFPYGKIDSKTFELAEKFPHANAVVLKEYGLARIEYNEIKGALVLRYIYHTQIFIRKKEGFEYADFQIPLYRDRSEREVIESLKAHTYSKTDENKIESIEFNKKNILVEKTSDRLEKQKIAFPNVKEGSIVEIRYSTESPFLFNLESWQFQSTIPKLHSEFVAEIPQFCHYNVNLKGYVRLDKRTDLPYNTKIMLPTGEARGKQTTYLATNIPAFEIEDYMTAPKNFMGTLTFELASFSIPFGPSHNYSRTWNDVRKILFDSDNFGKQLNNEKALQPAISPVIQNLSRDYDKAYTIYNHIKSSIRWNKNYGMYCEEGVKKALDKKSGNIADINLTLINALRAANLDANPVILSTRNNGFPSLFSPTISDYNYVVAHLIIDSTEYLLDASDKHSPFGLLPYRCINYQGQLLTSQETKSIPLQCNTIARISYDFDGHLDENGHLKGTLSIYRNGYTASFKREEILNSNSTEEYIENLQENTTGYKIINTKIENLDDPYSLLMETHQIEVQNFASRHSNQLKFIPFVTGRTSKNPFNLDERTYPVDLASPIEESFTFNIKLPDSYKVVNKPKNLNLALPNRDARFIYIAKDNGDSFSLQIQSSLNKPLFLPDEYLDLKEFYSQIIQTQTLDVTLSKQEI